MCDSCMVCNSKYRVPFVNFGFSDCMRLADINLPDIPPGSEPPSVARPDETPRTQSPVCRIRTQCSMSCSVTGKGVLNQGVMSGGFTSASPEI